MKRANIKGRCMKNGLLKLSATAIMFVVGLTAAQAQAPAGPNRPAAVPAGYVITPFGYFHPSCVVHLAQRDELRPDEGIIRHVNGTIANMPQCAYPHFRGDGEQVAGDERGIKTPDISHNWIISASVTTGSSYGELTAQWNVPPTPLANDGQTLQYFTGFEDANNVVAILQPVLSWNDDYPSAWGIASWNCCVKGTTFEATPQRVSPGDTILGYMFDNCAAGTTKTCTSWDVITWDLQSGKTSQLTDTSNSGQTFNWAFGGVLEVYNVAQCSDYPNNPNGFSGGTHTINFDAIGLYNWKLQQVVAPAWSFTKWAKGLTPQCGYRGTVPNQVVLDY